MGYSKVSSTLKKALHEWVINHPSVVASPIKKDTLKVRDPETGLKTKVVNKLLLEISVRELHNDLLDEKKGLGKLIRD